MPVKAVIVPRFGGPEVLELRELPERRPGADEVCIRVAAAVVNPVDLAMRAGRFPMGALPPPYILGMELGGVVEAVGAGVGHTRPGERVMAIVQPRRPEGGAQAELVVVPADSVAPAPAGLSLPQAATLPMNGLTVRRALDLLALPAGATLWVTGGAGAVGGYAIQLGKVAGLEVVADAQPSDVALVRELGADIVVPRGDRSAQAVREAVPAGVDAVLDGAVLGEAVLAAIREGGQLAAVRLFRGTAERGIRVHHVAVADYAHNRPALEELGRLAAAGRLGPRVAETFAPAGAADAHRRLQAGGVRGRLVIVF